MTPYSITIQYFRIIFNIDITHRQVPWTNAECNGLKSRSICPYIQISLKMVVELGSTNDSTTLSLYVVHHVTFTGNINSGVTDSSEL